MKIVSKIENYVTSRAKLHQIFSVLFAAFGLINLLVAIYMLYIKQIDAWYRQIYTNLLWFFIFQIYMGVIAAIAFSFIRKVAKDGQRLR